MIDFPTLSYTSPRRIPEAWKGYPLSGEAYPLISHYRENSRDRDCFLFVFSVEIMLLCNYLTDLVITNDQQVREFTIIKRPTCMLAYNLTKKIRHIARSANQNPLWIYSLSFLRLNLTSRKIEFIVIQARKRLITGGFFFFTGWWAFN